MSQATTKSITIGTETVQIPPLNFKTLKRIFPIAQKLNKEDPIAVMDGLCEILSVILSRQDPKWTADYIEDEMLVDQMPGMKQAFDDIMSISGMTKSGEDMPSMAEPPSTATSTGSLSSSSETDAVVETGTE